MKILEIKDLSKTISGQKVLHNVSFEINEGEVVGLVGQNGAGKSTLMKLVSNLIFPDNGEIFICGYNLKKERNNALNNLSSMIEHPPLFMHYTGYEHLRMIAQLRQLSYKEIDEAVRFSKLGDKIKEKTQKYSVGMKQRLYLAMCVMCKTKLMILDEPTNGLDFTGTLEFIEDIRHISTNGTSVLISSHILSDLTKICDRFVFIKNGEIKECFYNTNSIDVEEIYLKNCGEGQNE